MYLIGMLKKVSETEHGDMKPLNIETEKKEFKSLKSIKYSCKVLQFLYVFVSVTKLQSTRLVSY